MNDSHIHAQAYSYFLAEAPELLQTIESEILTLPDEHTTAKVHNLMRALHTLKGAAANVGLKTIERIAHDFEDLVRVFYNLEVEIDATIQGWLLDGYSALQECFEARVVDREIDEAAIIDRLAGTIDKLKERLGDWTEAEIDLPTSVELGFDIVASIFQTTVVEQIESLALAMAEPNDSALQACLDRVTETCIGLAESFELSGFLAINQAIVAAVSQHPDRLTEIANLALVNLQQAQSEVMAGDRSTGGTVDPAWTKFENAPSDIGVEVESLDWMELEITPAGEAELPKFIEFLQSDRFRKRDRLNSETQYLFTQVARLCWDWFRHEIQTPSSQLNLELLVTSDGLADIDYIHHWIGLLLKGITAPGERANIKFYRQCCIYQVIFAIAKYVAGDKPHPQLTPEFLMELRLYLQSRVDNYKLEPSVTANERGWLDRIILPHHWSVSIDPDRSEDLLLSEIWGQVDIGND
jgi:two-component system, chemotaxis family, sensor histidine kinase and response regulator PixL